MHNLPNCRMEEKDNVRLLIACKPCAENKLLPCNQKLLLALDTTRCWTNNGRRNWSLCRKLDPLLVCLPNTWLAQSLTSDAGEEIQIKHQSKIETVLKPRVPMLRHSSTEALQSETPPQPIQVEMGNVSWEALLESLLLVWKKSDKSPSHQVTVLQISTFELVADCKHPKIVCSIIFFSLRSYWEFWRDLVQCSNYSTAYKTLQINRVWRMNILKWQGPVHVDFLYINLPNTISPLHGGRRHFFVMSNTESLWSLFLLCLPCVVAW